MKSSPSFALPSGTIIRGKEFDYVINHYIGNGSFGITYMATVDIGGGIQSYFAIKEFFLNGFCGLIEF